MIKKIKLTGLALGLLIIAAIPTANATPLIIDSEFGQCRYAGETETLVFYRCADGSIIHVQKGGNGGNGDTGQPTFN